MDDGLTYTYILEGQWREWIQIVTLHYFSFPTTVSFTKSITVSWSKWLPYHHIPVMRVGHLTIHDHSFKHGAFPDDKLDDTVNKLQQGPEKQSHITPLPHTKTSSTILLIVSLIIYFKPQQTPVTTKSEIKPLNIFRHFIISGANF